MRRLTNQEAEPEWLTRPERSNRAAMRFMVWVALTTGRPVARLLLYPICLYFLCFVSESRTASRTYLTKALGHKLGFKHLFRHIHTFAATILDRVFLLNDQFGRFNVEVHGQEIVEEMVSRGEGGFLFGAHLGSFEVIRSMGRQAHKLRVGLVMYEENARKLNSVFDAINPNLSMQIIALGKVDSMLKVEQALEEGAFVGMLVDRTILGEGTIERRFLGEEAQFPIGPFRLAAMLKRPIVLMFGVYRGGNRYDVYFEKLTDMQHVERGERNAMIESALQNYVSRLEHYCRDAPYNWFNFYDFWK